VSEEPVVVATFAFRHEAEFALETLRAAGIEAMLVADDAGGAYAGLSLSGPARILVRAPDGERARALLESPADTADDQDE
jgi:hypothetical protein